MDTPGRTTKHISLASYPAFLLRHHRKEIKDLVDEGIHAYISLENQQNIQSPESTFVSCRDIQGLLIPWFIKKCSVSSQF